MTCINIIIPIDLQNGFARSDLSAKEGGGLYVPGGETASRPIADVMARAKNKIFILSQDFHPEQHGSFMESHKAVMQLRSGQVAAAGGNPKDRAQLMAPPFTNALIAKTHHHYEPVAVQVDGNWKKTITNFEHQVVGILNETVDPAEYAGSYIQTLWPTHCKQRSLSALFTPEIMAQLPEALCKQLLEDWRSPLLKGADERGNLFFVVRKGMNPDIDSYGIATENDRISLTKAPELFAQLAVSLSQQGITHADIDIGGLATNFN